MFVLIPFIGKVLKSKSFISMKISWFNTTTIITFLMVLIVLFLIIHPTTVDRYILLEDTRPVYWKCLGIASSRLFETEKRIETVNSSYVRTKASKDGFGGLSNSDIQFYLKSMKNMYPEADWTIISFQDGTGVEFPDNNTDDAIYGIINDIGTIDKGKNIDFNKSIQTQIDGITTIQCEYDNYRNIIHEIHLDANGNAISDVNGVAEYFRKYNRKGFVVWEKRLRADGLPAIDSSGAAEFRREYLGKNLISESYYDGYGNPVCLVDKLYSSVKYKYDNNHNCILEKYFDKYDNPIKSNLGYAGIRRTFDDNNNIASEAFFNEEGKNSNCLDGYSIIEAVYDDNRNKIEQKYYDYSGNLVISPYGYAEIKNTYDDRKVISESYFDIDGSPMKMIGGYYTIIQKWNGDSLIEREYLDDKGNPVERIDGYSKVVWEQDNGTWNVHFRNLADQDISIEGLNLVKDVKYGKYGWSEWMIPQNNIRNATFSIGTVNLGENAEGDQYTCSLEIEFKNVVATEGQDFRFLAQGKQDGKWSGNNIWNSELVSLNDAPKDGIFPFVYTIRISDEMTRISTFNIGFRCDNWASGLFRVRNVKIEKGNSFEKWSPGI